MQKGRLKDRNCWIGHQTSSGIIGSNSTSRRDRGAHREADWIARLDRIGRLAGFHNRDNPLGSRHFSRVEQNCLTFARGFGAVAASVGYEKLAAARFTVWRNAC
jgi:hypothetical protein